MNRYNDVLKQVFGYEAFKVGQKNILESIEAKHDVLGLMETGGGKSLCYQLPVIAENGRALVITPLIALMEDQVASLKKRRIKAAAVHSQLDIRDKHWLLQHMNEMQFIYCSPEWLAHDNAWKLFSQIDFTHIVIDEAHCISEWGLDFRPHYLLLYRWLAYYQNAKVIALTATANQKIIQDIQTLLRRPLKTIDVRHPRNNIFLKVSAIKEDQKIDYIKSIIETCGPTIIYFSSKKICNEINELLCLNDCSSMTYHADMTYEDRMNVQSMFMADSIQIVCATSAFGMGVDKANIRTVIHYHMPKSLFQYQQEIGRAGRDQQSCQAILLFDPDDVTRAFRLINDGTLTDTDVQLFDRGVKLQTEIEEHITILKQIFDAHEITVHLETEKKERIKRLQQMEYYATAATCLGQAIYQLDTSCGRCSRCLPEAQFQFESVHNSNRIPSLEEYISSLL